ncbi:uncharacterized protein LOC121584418 [Coregonus clupeaformis]|uniref:uncharacterized protein LOC121584418 n=1 Tax=Coregonus clupeaformis TaxID=59861 RepID=UPI001BE0E7A6|nr:uncharacterized protein LOC121584418 [Coregonus clupeaformis]
MVDKSEPLTGLPYTTPLPCHALSHTPGGRVFSGPEFRESPGHKELVLSSGPKEDTNDQPRFLGLDNPQAEQTIHKPIAPHPVARDGVSISGSLRDRDSTVTTCCSSVDTIQWLPGYGPLSRSRDLISSDGGCGEREDRVLGMQEHEEEKAVAEEEDPKTGLEGTSSIIPYGSSRVALEGERLDWGANGRVSEGLSVYEEYLLCVSRLDHLRTEQNQAPADLMTLPADVMTLSADVMTLPVDVMTLPADIMTLPADVMTLPADVMTLPADVMTLPADQRADPSERPLSTPAELVVAKQHVHQDIHNEGRRAPLKSSEVKNGRVLQPKSSGGQPGVRGQARVRGCGHSWRFWERSSLSWSSFTHGEVLPRSQLPSRPHSTGVVSKWTSPTEHSCSGPRPPTALQLPLGTAVNTNATNIPVTRALKLAPVGGCVQWLSLPDEVWVSILSLLPHRDLSTVAQVCLHLFRLANDHTLWQVVSVENSSSLTDQWLSSVGGRNPRNLTIYRCSGLSITPGGLEEFFKLSQASLEELSVTSCSGPGLHGDLVLTLSAQHCDHMTCVDVSWSGATDTGIKALTDTCHGLKTVVLNGCQVTDEALNALFIRCRDSLRRLEVFGCLSISPSCLNTVSELCPGLETLNIGQIPKVTHPCLTLVTSRLKRLHSLNLTGLHAVSDQTVHRVLLQCPDLQSLTLSSCPGVTDMSLHKISTHAPRIRLLDVSGCSKVSDAGVKAVAVACRRLQHLDLSSTATGNRGVSLLANYCSTHLHTVKLSFCQISPEAIHNLSRRCKRLKLLHLYGCAYIPTEKEIRDINPTVKLYPLT